MAFALNYYLKLEVYEVIHGKKIKIKEAYALTSDIWAFAGWGAGRVT